MHSITLFSCTILLFSYSFCFIAHGQSAVGSTDPFQFLLETNDLIGEEEIDSSLHFNYQNVKFDLNKVERLQLDSLGLLIAKQIEHFFQYRKSFGPFLDIHELQAIPLWDPTTIARIRRCVAVFPREWYQSPLVLNSPALSLLTIRWRPPVQNQAAANSVAAWTGDANYFRVTYRYSASFLKLGITAEKDPGELWINTRTKLPADYLSAYILVNGKGKVKQLLLGDFTVNLAQGLIQWQAMSFRKTPQLVLLKKSSLVFQPHRSSNEFNFHRGVAMQFQHRSHSLSLFFGSKRLSGNLGFLEVSNQLGITSFNTAGYHRTTAEINSQGNLSQMVGGGRYGFKRGLFSSGANLVLYRFSLPLIPTARAYDKYAILGKNWINMSMDLGYTYKNFHIFSEQAIDKNGSWAGLAGLLTSVTKAIEFGFLCRTYTKSFQSLYSNAIAEGTLPSNEKGLFFSLNARLSNAVSIQVFTDHFYFPWLRYLIDQPSRGVEQFTQINYQPDKVSTIYFRFRKEQKMQTVSDAAALSPIEAASLIERFHFRFQVERVVSKSLKWSIRMERSRVRQILNKSAGTANGFLGFFQLGFQPFERNMLKGTIRYLVFDTDDYQSRIYAFTPQAGGGFQLGQYSNSGREMILNIENEFFRIFSLQGSIVGTKEGNPKPFFWRCSVQISLKFHELATSKIYNTF